MSIKLLIVAAFCLFCTMGCNNKSYPPNFSFVVNSTEASIPEVIALVEKFSLASGLYQLKDGIVVYQGKDVGITFKDGPPISQFISVSNGNLKNKDHVEVSIFVMSHVKGCAMCKKFEASDEMRKIQEKFEIQNIVKNGEW